jgi:hypothetical protein
MLQKARKPNKAVAPTLQSGGRGRDRQGRFHKIVPLQQIPAGRNRTHTIGQTKRKKEDHPMASNKKIVSLVLITLVGLAFTGCSDSDSSPAAVAIDTAPPAVPSNLDMDYSAGAATMTWATNTVDADLAGYVVVRESNGATTTLVSAPALINSYVDNSPVLGVSYYHIYAVDTSGNQSAVATVNLVISSTHRSSDLSSE